jgi:hypothetical protein
VVSSGPVNTFTMRHEINCDQERFWKLFLDGSMQRRVVDELGFRKWEIVEEKDDEKEFVRIVKAIPNVEGPAASLLLKVLGDQFSYVEEGRFDKASKTFFAVFKASNGPGRSRNELTITAEPNGSDKCTRVIQALVVAEVFGIGRVIERQAEKRLREAWAKSADIFNAAIAEGKNA